jgi:phosphoribosylamine--glycine ligase
MSPLHVLILGGGGREHALAWKIAASPLVAHVYVAPGNPGTAALERVTHLSISSVSPNEVYAACREHGIGLVVVGPEAPLVAGVADTLRANGVPVVGPGADGARLEGSKAFCKEVLVAAGVPTARYAEVRTADEIHSFCDAFDGKALVVKADGLAAGKGVIVCDSVAEARSAALQMLNERTFGAASDTIVLEERLHGIETSYIVLTDGTRSIPFPTSQDHKRLLDGDNGPNTGGMGAYCPAPFVTPEIASRIQRDVIEPTLRELRGRGIDYRGFLYAGVMLTDDGPVVLEYNVRLGDPETQALLLAIEDDIVPALLEAANGSLATDGWAHTRPSAVVVLAAEGYPESPRKGAQIRGLDASSSPDAVVFHAGTVRSDDGAVRVNGGRVLGVASVGATPQDAVARAYARVVHISFDGMHYRSDVGRALAQSPPES